MKNSVTVDFPLLNKTVEVAEGTKLSDACAEAGYPLNLVCGGKGTCKKCAVEIQEGDSFVNVLSCQTYVYDGMKVMLKEEDQKAQILTSSTLDEISFNPTIKSIFIKRDSLKVEIGENDWDALKSNLPVDVEYPDLDVLQRMSLNFHNPAGIRVILNRNKIIDIVAGDHDSPLYGIAFDIGTTSVVGYLYDLNEGFLVGIDSSLNKQTELGGDVISRIDHVIGDIKNLARLQKLAMDSINNITENICKEHKISIDDIYYASICGNSTMQHLFLGLNPEFLGKVPFSSTTHKAVETKAKYLKTKMNPMGVVSFLPLLGGFVGADTTAVLLSIPNDGKNRLMIDLGTNGEIAVGNDKSYMVSSTACGPALEGAGIKYGMRGTKGAIEKVYIEDGLLKTQVIGNIAPVGICGSGVIDLMSVIFKNEVVNRRGALLDPDDIKNSDLARRIQVVDNEKVFVITFKEESGLDEDIYFSQSDIRQVQLAKGAIYTGCIMLINSYGIKGEDLHEIILAGAFGNYIDIKNAQSIGMLPWYEGVEVRSIGNAAGTGSQMYMLSEEKQAECSEIESNAIFIELANDPTFAKQYMRNTYFVDLAEN
ncbi:ASKHA domain-containing protein [Alkalibacter mobilis]|uniref:ASKHA domain-containing protein n=1 Tax=Alkalibacter mobilis TaxID=2787712 RepID=UPI00189DDE8E|nr:ASKHA domain-containing protein [Alkalibacter mobilis]MBF7096893.1 DUF4445 domain-containing protein [Alkalibacter mobilis]